MDLGRIGTSYTLPCLGFSMAFLLLALDANIASAQRTANKEELFVIKDLNKDEKLSASEFSGGTVGKMRETSDKEFGRKDLDKDGFLSIEEFTAATKWTDEEKEKKKQETVRQRKSSMDSWLKRRDQDKDLRLNLKEYCFEKNKGIDLAIARGRFVVLDKNQDGQLDLGELLDNQAIRTDPRSLLPKFDVDQNKKVSRSEYLGQFTDEKTRSANSTYFYRSDIDGSGELTATEFGNLLYIKGRTELIRGMPSDMAMMTYHDLNEDEKVDFEEFESLLKREKTTPKYIESLFQRLDKDKNETLVIGEIRRMAVNFKRDKGFAFFFRDIDSDGKLRLSEQVGPYVNQMEGNTRKNYFLDRDFDQSGWLSLQEFVMKEEDRRVQFLKLDVGKEGELKLEAMLGRAKDDAEKESVEELFRSHDLDRNDSLTKDEYILPPNSSIAKFGAADLDRDGLVGLMEFVSDEELQDPTSERLREFQAKDKNQNGYLDLIEFRMLKTNPRMRFGMKDLDGDGRLTVLEYIGPTQLIQKDAKKMADFRGRDLDRDGSLSIDEFQLSAKDPRVLFLIDDINGDGFVDEKELSSEENRNKRRIKLPERFIRFRDLNHDRRLDPEEHILTESDPRVAFNWRDGDENGTLSEKEFLTGVSRLKVRNVIRKVFFKKDLDDDGQLTPEEFATDANAANFEKKILRLPPKEREFARLDRSEDGLLDPSEFGLQVGDQEFSEMQAKKIFDTLDRDYNATLTLNEYLAKDDPTPQFEFARLDKNCDRMLAFGEFKPFAQDEKSPRKLFGKYDADQSNGLEPEEFVLLTNGSASRKRWDRITSTFTGSSGWMTIGMIVFDFILVFFIGRTVYRRFIRRTPADGRGGKEAV